MKKLLLTGGMLAAILLFTSGCGKQEAPAGAAQSIATPAKMIPVVAEQERSRSFLAVNQHLELGGTLYGYVDVDGDVLKVAGLINEIFGQMAAAQPTAVPYLKQDYAALFTALGLTDIKAVGFSSVPDGTGFFRNRTFFYTPGSRHGLLASLGGAPAPFARLGLAPADTDVYAESEIDLPAVYKTVREVVAQVTNEQAADSLEAQLKRTGGNVAFSLYSFIQGLKGRMTLVLRLDAEKELHLPAAGGAGIVLPGISLVLCLDGVAPVVEKTLAGSPLFKMTQEGGVHFYEFGPPLPLNGIKPVFAVDGTALYFATSREFLQECRSASSAGLAQRAEFKEALARVGPEGNALAYASPRFFQQLRRIETLNASMPPANKQVIHMVLRSLPNVDRPLVTIRSNLPAGILVNSYWNRSLKQDVAALAIYNPMTVGLMAAMAIPAFQKVRTASQEKAVLNNLRQLAAAANQYYLENGVTTARYEDLVGPTKYIRVITPVGGEDYRSLIFKLGQPLRVSVPVLKKTVDYAP